jgi:hypothetical protein
LVDPAGRQTNYTVTLTNGTLTVTSAAAKFTSASLSEGALRIVLAAGAGQNYALDRSTNLLEWTPLATNTVPAAGTLTFTDTPSTNNSKTVYYRARLAP